MKIIFEITIFIQDENHDKMWNKNEWQYKCYQQFTF